MQIRNITTRQIEGNYENIFRATLTILQDNGYIIKNTDMNSGLIVATIDREVTKTSQFFQAFWTGYIYNKGTFIEISAMVSKISEHISEIRMNIQETNYGQWGGKQNIKQIYDPEIYEALFNSITIEVKRREAMGNLQGKGGDVL